jgi:hypothetical protein
MDALLRSQELTDKLGDCMEDGIRADGLDVARMTLRRVLFKSGTTREVAARDQTGQPFYGKGVLHHILADRVSRFMPYMRVPRTARRRQTTTLCHNIADCRFFSLAPLIIARRSIRCFQLGKLLERQASRL